MSTKDQNMPTKGQTNTKDHNRTIWTTYVTEEELIAATNFIKDVEEYHDNIFNNNSGKLQVNDEFMRYLIETNKEYLIKKKQRIYLTIMVHYKKR